MMQDLLKSLTGGKNTSGSGSSDMLKGLSENMGQLSGKIPGGLVGGAAAGGLMALLIGNKSARKFASKAAGYGFLAGLVVLFFAVIAMFYTTAVTVKMLPYDNKSEVQVVIDMPEGSTLVLFLGLWYVDDYRRTAKGWRISRRQEERSWVFNTPDFMDFQA